MARFWIDKFDRRKVRRRGLNDPLIPQPVYCVRVCTITFRFRTVQGIRSYLDFFSQKIHPSSRLPRAQVHRGEHGVIQRWYERLPLWLFEEPKRLKVVNALQQALVRWDKSDAKRIA